MVDFATHFTIHAIKINFQKEYSLLDSFETIVLSDVCNFKQM